MLCISIHDLASCSLILELHIPHPFPYFQSIIPVPSTIHKVAQWHKPQYPTHPKLRWVGFVPLCHIPKSQPYQSTISYSASVCSFPLPLSLSSTPTTMQCTSNSRTPGVGLWRRINSNCSFVNFIFTRNLLRYTSDLWRTF
jgi:hypothetical protein